MSFDDIDMSIPSIRRPKRLNKRIEDAEQFIFSGVSEATKEWARKLVNDHWLFVVCKHRASWASASERIINISMSHLTSGRLGYKEYVICHEMAHAFDKCLHDHGPEFMEWLKKICPPEFIHYELEYKPRNAASAGIGKPNIADDLGF